MLFDYFIQLLYTVFSYKQCCGYPIFKVFLEPPATHCTGDRYVLGEYISDYYKSGLTLYFPVNSFEHQIVYSTIDSLFISETFPVNY